MTSDEPGSNASPKPVPRPGPRPGPRPVSPGPRPAPLAVHPASDPHRFGRVDDDGTVWLISSAGERVVGSWQAGDREAAFAHFGRRFDDLATEVTLMEERLAAGTGDARKIKAHATELSETLPTASVLGDVDGLAARLAGLLEHADATIAEGRSKREEHRAAQTARKEALAAEAEDLAANATQWKAAGDRLRAILDEWKTITGLDRKVDDALWKRYSAARDTFNRRRGSHFAELDRERSGIRQSKERLCERAEELSDSTDWTATSAEFRKLLTEWKAAGRASRDVDDALWRRFKAAQDCFFTARNAAAAEKDAEFRANATAKEALLAEAEKIDTSNLDAARAALRSIADKWDAIGKVPRERSAELERRLRAVEKKVRDAGDADWSDPQAQARAEQFRTRAEQYEQQAQKAAAAGRTKEADEARANAEQWRQWADAAAEALTRRS
ncbi:DNA repair ATPase [Mycobacterium sp. 1554424.7]|nr:DNA repair ATPase [Mycobacterium sp. 1554424.7]